MKKNNIFSGLMIIGICIAVILGVINAGSIGKTNKAITTMAQLIGVMGATGDTNLTNLVLSGDLTVGDDVTIGDDVVITDDMAMSGRFTVIGGTVFGGNIASEGNAEGTFTTAQICDNAGFNMLVSLSLTLTTPTSVSFIAGCLDDVMDVTPFWIYNHNASEQLLTIAAGTGVEFKFASASVEEDTLEIASNEAVLIHFMRTAVTSVSAFVQEFK